MTIIRTGRQIGSDETNKKIRAWRYIVVWLILSSMGLPFFGSGWKTLAFSIFIGGLVLFALICYRKNKTKEEFEGYIAIGVFLVISGLVMFGAGWVAFTVFKEAKGEPLWFRIFAAGFTSAGVFAWVIFILPAMLGASLNDSGHDTYQITKQGENSYTVQKK